MTIQKNKVIAINIKHSSLPILIFMRPTIIAVLLTTIATTIAISFDFITLTIVAIQNCCFNIYKIC